MLGKALQQAWMTTEPACVWEEGVCDTWGQDFSPAHVTQLQEIQILGSGRVREPETCRDVADSCGLALLFFPRMN